MLKADPSYFHKLYGNQKRRINYQKKDSVDYCIMMMMVAGLIWACYKSVVPLLMLGWLICGWMIAIFIIRHGFTWSTPLLVRRPQDIFFMFIHKVENIRPMYWIALSTLAVENILVQLTPNLPHNVEFMRNAGWFLFFLSLGGLTIYRTVILVDHLRKKHIVRDFLMESAWKTFITKQPSISVEIFHAYFTGLLTHLVLVAPWFLVIKYLNFSVVFMPVVLVINVVCQFKFLRHVNSWYYRDHWLGHNSEVDFVYLHGSHHDAIPSGLIGVAGNGFLEGFLRNTIAYPTPFYNPLAAFLFYSVEIQKDILYHQYIPCVYPHLNDDYLKLSQHSTHHFGKLEPYGFGNKLEQEGFSDGFSKQFKFFPDEFTNAVKLEEELTGFEWDNPRHRWYIATRKKYEQTYFSGDR